MARKCYNKTNIESYSGLVLSGSGLNNKQLVSAKNFFTYGMVRTCLTCGYVYTGTATGWTCPDCHTVYARGTDATTRYAFAAGTGSTRIIAEGTLLTNGAELSYYEQGGTKSWTCDYKPWTYKRGQSVEIYYNGASTWSWSRVSGSASGWTIQKSGTKLVVKCESWPNCQSNSVLFKITAPDSPDVLSLTMRRIDATCDLNSSLQWTGCNGLCVRPFNFPYMPGSSEASDYIDYLSTCIPVMAYWDTFPNLMGVAVYTNLIYQSFPFWVPLEYPSAACGNRCPQYYGQHTDENRTVRLWLFNYPEDEDPRYVSDLLDQTYWYDVVYASDVNDFMSNVTCGSWDPNTTKMPIAVSMYKLDTIASWRTNGKAILAFQVGGGPAFGEEHTMMMNGGVIVLSKATYYG